MLKKKEPASAILWLPLIMAASFVSPRISSAGETAQAMTLRECIAARPGE